MTASRAATWGATLVVAGLLALLVGGGLLIAGAPEETDFRDAPFTGRAEVSGGDDGLVTAGAWIAGAGAAALVAGGILLAAGRPRDEQGRPPPSP